MPSQLSWKIEMYKSLTLIVEGTIGEIIVNTAEIGLILGNSGPTPQKPPDKWGCGTSTRSKLKIDPGFSAGPRKSSAKEKGTK